MKFIIGIILILIGAIFGIYAGIYFAFIGGITDVINGLTAEQLNASKIAVGVAKVFFTAPIGWLSAAVFVLPGAAVAFK